MSDLAIQVAGLDKAYRFFQLRAFGRFGHAVDLEMHQ